MGRGGARRHYPNDYLHADRPYEEVQADVGGGILLAAVMVLAVVAILASGLP